MVNTLKLFYTTWVYLTFTISPLYPAHTTLGWCSTRICLRNNRSKVQQFHTNGILHTSRSDSDSFSLIMNLFSSASIKLVAKLRPHTEVISLEANLKHV